VRAARTGVAGLRDHPVSAYALMASAHGCSASLALLELFKTSSRCRCLFSWQPTHFQPSVQLLTLCFFPDSPHYLLIDKKDKEECIKGKEMGHKVFILAKSETTLKPDMSLEERCSWE